MRGADLGQFGVELSAFRSTLFDSHSASDLNFVLL
jgi:hypothetical protein